MREMNRFFFFGCLSLGETSLYQRSDKQTADQPGFSYEERRNRNRVDYEQKANSPKPGASRAPPPPASSDPNSGSTLSWATESSSSGSTGNCLSLDSRRTASRNPI